MLKTAKAAQKEPEVKYWDVDITQSPEFRAVLAEVGRMGQISCVLFNAARVGPSPFFDFSEEDLINDFKVCDGRL